jgi:hypothetical protein
MRATLRRLAARLGSPLFFVVAGLCFLLPFATVSCDGETGPPQPCTQAVNWAPATYTGIDLLMGNAPSVAAPGACPLSSQANATSSPTTVDPLQTTLREQPLVVVAFALILVGLFLGLIHRVTRVTKVVVAAILILLIQWVMDGLPLLLLTAVRVTPDFGAIACVVALVLAARSYRAPQRWTADLIHPPPAAASEGPVGLGGQFSRRAPPPQPEPPLPPTPAP